MGSNPIIQTSLGVAQLVEHLQKTTSYFVPLFFKKFFKFLLKKIFILRLIFKVKGACKSTLFIGKNKSI